MTTKHKKKKENQTIMCLVNNTFLNSRGKKRYENMPKEKKGKRKKKTQKIIR